jgi:hypothetical protein
MKFLASPLFASLALGATLLAPSAASAADAAATPAASAKPAAAKPASNAAKKKDEAKGLALAKETVQQISDAQLQVADRVLTGDAACEFNQTVSVLPVKDHPGHFHVAFKKVTYTMVPEETTTGAVRLEDKKSGVMWLQIPAKSMLMNTRIGQRMVDSCMHSEQTAAVAAVEAAARSGNGASAPTGLGVVGAAAAGGKN